jgi:hypothetical protein
MPSRHAEHARAARSDDQAWPALERGQHVQTQPGDLVGSSGLVYLGPLEQPADDGEGLLEPVDPLPGGLKVQARRLIFGPVPARAEAELKAAAGQMVQGRGLVGDEHWMPEIVGQDQCAHVQAGRGRGCGGQGAERG